MLNQEQLTDVFDNEQILIILLSRLHFGRCDSETVVHFIDQHKINWQQVYQIMRAQGLQSFLFCVINDNGINVPLRLKQELAARYAKTKIKNFRQLKLATQLINYFKEQRIKLIPYKGVLFGLSYYENWSARESIDIDFLVDKKDVALVEDYFIKHNFQPLTTVPRAFLKYYQLFFKDIVYFEPDDKVTVEVHWRLMDKFVGNSPPAGFFSPYLVPVKNGSFTTNKLSPTYDFLAIAFNHFVKDLNGKLKYLIDAGAIITKCHSELDIKAINDCAKEYAFEKRLTIGIGLLNDLLGIELMPVDNSLTHGILKAPLNIKPQRLYITERSFIKRSLQMQDNLLQKIKFIFRVVAFFFLPTYADINELKLPVYLLPLMIIIRPFRIMYRSVIKPSSSSLPISELKKPYNQMVN